MDALELLKLDHQRVSDLFREAETSDSLKKKRVIFESIRSELELHTYIEETVFYPAFRKFDGFQDILSESYTEHKEVKEHLNRIESLLPESAELTPQLNQLKHRVEHHVHEEESNLFVRIRKVMTVSEREKLGRHLQIARQEKEEAAA